MSKAGLTFIDALQTCLPGRDWDAAWNSGRIGPAWSKFCDLLLKGGVVGTGTWDGINTVVIEPQLWENLYPRAMWLRAPDKAMAWMKYIDPDTGQLLYPDGLPARELGDPIYDADVESEFLNSQSDTSLSSVRFQDCRGGTSSIRAERECAEWIRTKAADGTLSKTKKAVRAKAKRLWPSLSGAGFDRAPGHLHEAMERLEVRQA